MASGLPSRVSSYLNPWRLVLVATLAACSASGSAGSGATKDGLAERSVSLFFTTELRGTIEPCGCTTNPLGDIARTAELINRARAEQTPVLYIDGGSTLFFRNKVEGELKGQETLMAELILDLFEQVLKPAAVGLGPFDLSNGPGAVKPARLASNIDGGEIPLTPATVVDAGGIKVGLFGVVSPGALDGTAIRATDPIEAAKKDIASLRNQGAELVVGIAHMSHQEATELARQAPGADVVLVGQRAPEPARVAAAPAKIGKTYLIAPANRGQVVSHFAITLRKDGDGMVDAIGKSRAAVEIARLDERIANIESDLDKWKKAASQDQQQFIAEKEKELEEIRAERSALETNPLRVPKTGSYFTLSQIKIEKGLACTPAVVAQKIAYDKKAGQANLAAAKGKKPPPAADGKAGYMGVEECSYCHDEQVEFWKKTRHADAWKTLVDAGKEYNFDCISCHVSGFGKPGGSSLAFNETLRDVQCEICHGPGSIHVDQDGKEKPPTLTLSPAKDLCVECHSEEHSDTFNFEAYLRDVTGPGHGATFREKLGDGPTGKELRSEGLKKAGSDIGANCPK